MNPPAAILPDHLPWICQEADGTCHTASIGWPILFPGSFNPLHRGHLELARLAMERLGGRLAFELSISNVDKPELSADDVRTRLRQFQGRHAVVITRAATFRAKAELFPGTTFAIGADTAERILSARYYASEEHLAESLRHVRVRGCRFFVAGRLDRTGRFQDAASLPIPPEFQDLFTGLAESDFRVDLSSTELRASASSRVRG